MIPETKTLSLPEALRREYLRALGIESYFPRVQLPCAPESALVGLVDPSAVMAEPAHPESPQDEPSARPVPEKPAPAIRPAPAARQETAPTTPAETQKPVRQREEIRLKLLCIRAGNDLAVINAMPHAGQGLLSPRHSALLVNLLKAAGIAVENLQSEDKPFNWPMVTGLHVDNSKRAAATALSAYLQQKLADWQCNKLLVMGEEVVGRLFGQDNPGEDDAASVPSLENGKWQLVYTRSLDELLQRPTLKKETWMQIRKLRS
jgi:hypothetical protein